MSKTHLFSVQLSDRDTLKLAELADLFGATSESMIRDAVTQYLAEKSDLGQHLKASLKAEEEGRVFDHDEVAGNMQKLRSIPRDAAE